MKHRSNHIYRAFTLIEIVACILIMSVLTTAVVLLPSNTYRTNPVKVSHKIIELDRHIRAKVKANQTSGALIIDLDQNVVRGKYSQNNQEKERVLQLDKYVVIKHIVTQEKHRDSGEHVIGVSMEGYSQSYALVIENGEGKRQVFVVSGLSGNHCFIKEIEDAEKILQD